LTSTASEKRITLSKCRDGDDTSDRILGAECMTRGFQSIFVLRQGTDGVAPEVDGG
jgi:hypothetical protein